MASFLILHGLGGSGPDHWQTWLTDRLRASGDDVRFPDLPACDDPDHRAWQATIESELDETGPDVTVLCHSLACLAWLRIASAATKRRAGRVALVAPPHTPDVEAVVRFRLPKLVPKPIHLAARETRLVWSPGDPYCPDGAAKVFGAPLRLTGDRIERGGHLNTDAGYGPWPGIEAWARGQSPTVAPR